MNEQRVRALLGARALEPLVDRLVRRVRLGRPLTRPLTIAAAAPETRAAVAALLGRPIGSGAAVSVPIVELERIVRESGAAADLREALEVLRGPLLVAAEEAEADRARWARATEPIERFVDAHPAHAYLLPLLVDGPRLRAGGQGPEEAGRIARALVRVLEALPARGQTIAAFSAAVLGSAHALDRGRLRSLLAAVLDAAPALEGDEPDDRWARVGLAVDPSASSVLVLSLSFDRASAAGRVADDHRALGRPHLVTLGQLQDGAEASAGAVFVCENMSVIAAAAARFGTACAPLVCLRGQPSVAAQRLVAQLSDAGAVLRYHGDFDWGGIRIANRVMALAGAEPWRFRTEDLLAADLPGPPLAGSRVEAVWDDRLADAVEQRGRRLEEEQVLSSLLPDLAL